MSIRILAYLSILLLSASGVSADYDVLEKHLFEPELVMKHQRDIELSADQRETIMHAIQQAQATYVELEWALQEETAEMEELVMAQQIDLAAAQTQANVMLELENKVKITQLTMLVQIKNTLTQEQQDQLMQLKNRWWGSENMPSVEE